MTFTKSLNVVNVVAHHKADNFDLFSYLCLIFAIFETKMLNVKW